MPIPGLSVLPIPGIIALAFPPAPALDLNFAGMGGNVANFPADITFARASNATQFDSQGRLVWAPANFAVNTEMVGATVGVIGSGGSLPTGWAWNSAGTGLVREVVAVGTTPDGLPFVDVRLSGTNTSGSLSSPHIQFATALHTANLFQPNQLITVSCWTQLIAGALNGSSSGRLGVQWRDSSGIYLSEFADSSSRPTGSMARNVTNASAAVANTNRISAILQLVVLNNESVDLTIRISRPQVELTGPDSPKRYLPNSSTSGPIYGPRLDYNPATLAPRGLLIEESRTNSCTNSEDLSAAAWSKTDSSVAKNVIGPQGQSNSAWTVTEGSAGTASITHAGATVTAGSTLTGSFYLKRGNTDWVRIIVGESTLTDGVNFYVNLNTGVNGSTVVRGAGTGIVAHSVQSVGNGWYRFSVTVVPNGAYTTPSFFVASATADGNAVRVNNATYLYGGGQLEVGAFPTSYIPTFGTAAIRAAETAVMTGTNFSSWYNQAAGTFAIEVPVWGPNDGTNTRRNFAVSIGTATTEQSIYCTRGAASSGNWGTVIGGVATALPVLTGAAIGQFVKIAGDYGATGRRASVNGAAPLNNATPSSVGVMDRISFGGPPNYVAAQYSNSWISRIRYWPHADFTNAQLQALST